MQQDRARILIVDDTPDMLDLVEQELMDDYDVVPVSSGEAALEEVKDWTPDWLQRVAVLKCSFCVIGTYRSTLNMKNARFAPVLGPSPPSGSKPTKVTTCALTCGADGWHASSARATTPFLQQLLHMRRSACC